MVNKRAEVEFRIKSTKGLAKKDISEVVDELDRLTESQKEQATAAGLASKSLKDLGATQRELSKVAQELSRRESLVQSLIGKQGDLASAKSTLNSLRQELAELLAIKSKGSFLGDIDGAIKKVRSTLTSAEKDFSRTSTGVEKLTTTLSALGVDTTDTAGALNSITTNLNRAQAAIVDQTSDLGRYAQAQNEVAAADRKAAEAQKFVNEQLARQTARRTDAAAGFAGLDALEAQNKALAANGVEVERVQGIHDRFAAVLARNEKYQRALSNQLGLTNTSIDRQSKEVATVQGIHDRFAAVLAKNEKYQKALANQTNATAAATEKQGNAAATASAKINLFEDAGRKSLSVYQRLRGEILAITATYVGFYQAVGLLTNALEVSQKRQALLAQLNTANGGNARYVAEDQAYLRKEAERLGVVYDDLAEKFANFTISAKAAGLGTDEARKAFSQATEVVVGMHLSVDDADGVFRAFVQIMSKARVQAEELRGQLGDRLPGAVAAFAKANNLALSDLDAYLQKGKGNLQDFLKFLGAYAKQNEAAVESGSKTLFADINRLKTAYNDFLETVAKGGVSSDLQKAVQDLTNALKGQQGAQFAKDLAAAFSTVAKVLQFVIENFDTFLTLAKLFLALQVAKGVVATGAAFAQTATSVLTAAKNFRTFYAAAVAARTASVALTASQAGLLAILGPIGAALAAAAAAIYLVSSAAQEAEARMDSFVDTLSRAAKVSSTAQVDISTAELNTQLAASVKEMSELKKISEDWESRNPIKSLANSAKAFGKDLYTAEAVTLAIRTEQEKQAAIQERLVVLGKQRAKFDSSEKSEDAARSATELAAAQAQAAAVAKKDSQAQAKLDAAAQKKADAAAKRELAAENARASASRNVQKQILDLDQAIYDARTEGEVTSSEQIQKNYELTIRKIESQIAEKQLEIDRLAQSAAAANGGTVTSEDAKSVDLARKKVELLNEELNRRALNASYTADVALGEKKVNDLIAQRDAKIAAINELVDLGLKTEVEGRREAIAVQQEYSAGIVENINALIETLRSLPPNLFAQLGGDVLIAQLETTRIKATQVKSEIQLIGENLGGQFATGAATGINTLLVGLGKAAIGTGSLADGFNSAAQSFGSFIASFLQQITEAILQALILKAIMNTITGGSGGYTSAALGALGVKNHTGGVVGSDGAVGIYPASLWKNAPRFHDGGLPGLKSNEVATILEQGEEVLTADDPRHVANGGASGGATVSPTIINTFDREDLVGELIKAKSFGPAILNYFGKNANAIKQKLA